MEYFFLFIAILAIVFLLSFFLKFFRRESKSKNLQEKNDSAVFVHCPICNSPLAKGENLHSKIFRPMTTPDQRMTVQGCPHCFPSLEKGIIRRCPVCRKNLDLNEELIARLFNRPDGKKHVLVTGCSICCNVKKNISKK